MSPNTPSRWKAFRLQTLSAAALSTMLLSNANAVGLGDLSVQSSLGEPLRAEIALVSSAKEDDGPLRVKLASYEAYRQANVEFNTALLSLRFAVEQRDNKPVIRVVSSQPMNEPFIDLLLELSSSSGRMVREYVFLLDPASLQPVQAAVAPKPAAPVATHKPAAEKTPAPAKPAPRTAPAATPHDMAPAKTSAQQETIHKPAAAAGGKPRLKLSSINAVSGPNADTAEAVNREEYASMEKALADANARVKALETKVSELQKLLEVTNSLLAELQKQNALTKAAAKPEAPVAAIAATPAAEAKSAAPAVAPAAPVKRKPAPPPPEPGLLDEPLLLPGAGLLLAALAAAGLYVRRKRAQKPFDATMFDKTTANDRTTAGSQNMDAGTMNPAYSLLDNSSHTGEVDVISEADVYIAYGRDVQAEEVLKEALLRQPERHALRLKLLGIYAGRKDAHAYEALARELYKMTKGEGEDWVQAASMGSGIDPGNPLYAQGKPPAQPENIIAPPEHAPEAVATFEPVEESEPATPQPDLHDLDFAAAEMPPAEEPAALEFAAEEAPKAQNGPIDFALPDVPAVDQAEEPMPDAGKAETGPIDFDFVLPSIPIPEEPPRPVEREVVAEPLDFDFVLPEIPVEEQAEAEVDAGALPELEPARIAK